MKGRKKKKTKKKPEISRRDFLSIFPGLVGKKAAEVGGSLAGKAKSVKRAVRRRPAGDSVLRLPATGELLDGLPLRHEWIGAAWAIARHLGRPRTLAYLLGASGEAFSLVYSREDPLAALRQSPGNTFLAALAVSGIMGLAAHGGPFTPAIGGVEVSLGRTLTVVIATGASPAVVAGVEPLANEVSLLLPGKDEAKLSFEELEPIWESAQWPGGDAPFLRVTLEVGKDRQPELVAAPAAEAMVGLISRDSADPYPMGRAAWEAWAEDLKAGAITDEQAEVLHGVLLPRLAGARLAASAFLAEIAPAVKESARPLLIDAAARFREMHAPSILGDTWGTGLLPEAAECLIEDETHDPEKLATPDCRQRAAEIFLQCRDLEAEAAELVREAFA